MYKQARSMVALLRPTYPQHRHHGSHHAGSSGVGPPFEVLDTEDTEVPFCLDCGLRFYFTERIQRLLRA